MSRVFPRLLVATEFPPNASGGGPAVVRQMLQGWPTEKLFWWSPLPDSHAKFGQNTKGHFVAAVPPKLYPHATLSRVKAGAMAAVWVPFASAHLAKTIRQAQPDAIWAIPHQWSIPPLAKTLPKSSIPYHISIHDFPDAHHPEQKVGNRIARRMIAGTDELYRRARSRDAISGEMTADLAARTGAAADQIVHAGLESVDFTYLETKRATPGNKIKIAYAGTVIAEEVLLLFIESLNRIGSQLPKPLELHFFGAHSYRGARWFHDELMIEHGDLAAPELKRALQAFDWGFAPMELDDRNPRYNRFSLPTKIASYLVGGLPIISVAHHASTISQLARRYSFGLSIAETELEKIDEILKSGLADLNVWDKYRSEILRCGRSEFDAETTRSGLWARLGVAVR